MIWGGGGGRGDGGDGCVDVVDVVVVVEVVVVVVVGLSSHSADPGVNVLFRRPIVLLFLSLSSSSLLSYRNRMDDSFDRDVLSPSLRRRRFL
jgi:hypothetical protein